MSVKYQVFVSSTYEDLRREREQVVKAVLEMGHIPVGMEMFSAADEQQWQIISRHIESSDYYVIIVAHRYGSMEGDRSFTEKEYDYAIQCGIPVLGFVIDETAEWQANKIDNDQQKRDALTRFKDKVKGRYISYWKSADDLYGKVSIALLKEITVHPRTGWVRADQAAGPEVLAELARLSKESSDLRSQLEAASRNVGRDALNSWKEFIDKAHDYRMAALREKEISMDFTLTQETRDAAKHAAHEKNLQVDKTLVKLEVEFRGTAQEGNLERAYDLVERIRSSSSKQGEIMAFARSVAPSLRGSTEEPA